MSCNHETTRNDKPQYSTPNYTCVHCGKDFTRTAPRNKYNVTLMRKHLSTITEYIIGEKKGETTVFFFESRSGDYEIRGQRHSHGITLSWGRPGTFYCPDGYYNTEKESPVQTEERLQKILAKKQGKKS
jgi:hypothetical protein